MQEYIFFRGINNISGRKSKIIIQIEDYQILLSWTQILYETWSEHFNRIDTIFYNLDESQVCIR